MKLGAAIPALNEFRFLPAVVGQLLQVVDRIVLLRGNRSFSGEPVDLLPVPRLDPRVEVLEGLWWGEAQTRNAGMDLLADCEYVFGIDTDEILIDEDLASLRDICERERPAAVAVPLHTYWKSPQWRIEPPEPGKIKLVLRQGTRFEGLRGVAAPARSAEARVRHLSYVRTDEEMKEKLRTWGHASEVVPGWYEKVWKAWDADHELRNLHPVHPAAYPRAVQDPDSELEAVLAKWGCKWTEARS